MNTNELHSSRRSDSTILIVDDEPLFLDALGKLLQPNYQVRVANSGARTLAMLQDDPRPDLVILDVVMPDMDGFEVLRRLKEDETTRDIPVIFITGLHDDESEQRGLELGAVDFVHKPLKSLTVLSRVRSQLEAKAARDMLRFNNLRLKNQISEGAHALEQAQAQLMQSEKMAALGQLAAGIAHEINNPIGFVGSNLSTLESYLQDIFAVVTAYEACATSHPSDQTSQLALALHRELDYDFLRADTAALLAESKDGINRVRKISQDLKNFSRISDDNWRWVDLHEGLEAALNIVWNELKYHCSVVKNYRELPLVHCLPSQIDQVFMNLLVNAGQAIEDKGVITISTEKVGNDEVRVMISDTGKGISSEVLPHIFEPFYTTKPLGKGTGLGLSLSRSIIQRHNGKLEVISEVGNGTTFSITLPISATYEGERIT